MSDEIRKRFTAYKASLGLIAGGNIEFEQERFSKLVVSNREMSRVNIMATVVDKYTSADKPYVSATIDDGTGNITVRAFSDNISILKNIEVGDVISVIGMLRYFNNELYIIPEIVKNIDAKWLLVRKLELMKEYGSLYAKKKEIKEEKNNINETATLNQNEYQNKILDADEDIENVKIGAEEKKDEKTDEITEIPQSVRTMVLDFIEKNESEGGVNVDKLIMSINVDVEEIKREIIELLEEGTIYEPKPGNLRIL